jgi:hypothetical protein
VRHFDVILVADSAFDEADIHVSRILLHIDDGAVNDVGIFDEFHQELVEVQERHVAAGTAAEPNCG